jgi:NhaA family Na+:H+ antiporter
MLLVLYILSYLKIHSKFLLLIFGIVIWVLFLKSGIHPTIAGILLAFAVPIRQRVDEFTFAEKLQEITSRITLDSNTNKLPLLTASQIAEIDNLEDCTDRVQSPLQKLEKGLHNWVAYLIMPVFALSNAGINLVDGANYELSLATTVALSLFLGKAIGVSLFSYIALKTDLASLPENTSFIQIVGVAVLSGVGFTMSLFIGGLAFPSNMVFLSSAKIGIIVGSVVSGIIGYLILRYSGRVKS